MTDTITPVAEGELTEEDVARARVTLGALTETFRSRVVGQDGLRVSLLIALVTGGHVLLESVPGLAKTLAASTLAASIQGTFQRIQCTPDLLPSDVVGTQVYDAATATFKTQLGPIHANFILVDEINRASAKTHSAMLEAMQERQTTIGGIVHRLPDPFVVLATQNPIEQEGTYPLPEAQLDRFLLKEVLSFPEPSEELEVLHRVERGVYDTPIRATGVTAADIRFVQRVAKQIYVDESVKQYVVRLIHATRVAGAAPGHPAAVGAAPPAGGPTGGSSPVSIARHLQYGVSPRGSIALLQSARAMALLYGRGYVIPEDVKQLRYSALRHRIVLTFEALADGITPEHVIDALFLATPTP